MKWPFKKRSGLTLEDLIQAVIEVEEDNIELRQRIVKLEKELAHEVQVRRSEFDALASFADQAPYIDDNTTNGPWANTHVILS